MADADNFKLPYGKINDPGDVFIDELGANRKFNYDLLIDLNLHRLIQLAAERSNNDNVYIKLDDFTFAVQIYSEACLPYHNDEYKAAAKKAAEEYEAEQKRLVLISKQISDTAFTTAIFSNRSRYAKTLFRAIVTCLNDNNKLDRKKVIVKDGFKQD